MWRLAYDRACVFLFCRAECRAGFRQRAVGCDRFVRVPAFVCAGLCLVKLACGDACANGRVWRYLGVRAGASACLFVCLFFCLFVCLLFVVCLFVCLFA